MPEKALSLNRGSNDLSTARRGSRSSPASGGRIQHPRFAACPRRRAYDVQRRSNAVRHAPMPIVAHTSLPSFEDLRRAGQEVLSLDGALHQDIRELHIGLLNMMPDAALRVTERQF